MERSRHEDLFFLKSTHSALGGLALTGHAQSA
jgi:hypothetical protein